jgi:hypothetical protein
MQAKLGESSAASKVKKLDDYLASRGWHGELRNRQGGVVIVFPGATAAKPVEETRTVQQMDSLIGTVIKIGGRDETVPMQLRTQDGRYLDVTVRGRTKAQQLGSLLFQEVRVKGLATWQRDKEGVWACTGMLVDDFDQPNTRPLVDLFDEWAGLPGNDWQLIEDPEGEWLKIRGSEQ